MKKILFAIGLVCLAARLAAHPMPSSIVELSVHERFIRGVAKIPLVELANAVGEDRTKNIGDPFFRYYFKAHIKAVRHGMSWATDIESIRIETDNDPTIGAYQEVIVVFRLTPPDTGSLRTFSFDYDVVIHQVVTHSALVFVTEDWNNGINQGSSPIQLGVIQLDIPTGRIYPLEVDILNGSWWKGFASMLTLGMRHIREGTDHLLFLIVLLLPAMLRTASGRWTAFGGLSYSMRRLIRIVTAFTIGHSVTLLVGALGWCHLPGKPVEVMIAFSILVSAVHAVRPIFPGRENVIAAAFGLVHGLAFATVLSNLELSAGKLTLTILGFNLGIEAMQLLVIAMIVPWLILLSRTPAYQWLRPAGAVAAGIAAIGWMVEKATGQPNFVTGFIEDAAQSEAWCIGVLCIISIVAYALTLKKKARKVYPSY